MALHPKLIKILKNPLLLTPGLIGQGRHQPITRVRSIPNPFFLSRSLAMRSPREVLGRRFRLMLMFIAEIIISVRGGLWIFEEILGNELYMIDDFCLLQG